MKKTVLKKDQLAAVTKSIRMLAGTKVMVGIPSTKAERTDGPLTNAQIGYIQENGSPETNLPARPFLVPGVKGSKEEWMPRLKDAATAALDGRSEDVKRNQHAAGGIAAAAAKKVIVDVIPPPLSERTIEARIARRESQTWRKNKRKQMAANVAAGKPSETGIFTPLIDTGKLLRSITHVIRKL